MEMEEKKNGKNYSFDPLGDQKIVLKVRDDPKPF